MGSLTWRTEYLSLNILFYIVRDIATEEVLCPMSTPTTISRRNVMLYDHNLYRSRVAQGYPVHVGRKEQPVGSNIYKVRWSCDLEKLAYLAVKDCSTRKVDVPNYGQNYELVSLFSFEALNDYTVENPYSAALNKWVAPMAYKTFNNAEVTFVGDNDLRPFANISDEFTHGRSRLERVFSDLVFAICAREFKMLL
ncbi:unnamed protein product [Cylicostephanus goldi]|uniref:SCP domain-containing protein n=1 Tax=Cylicostephanus goldi TaxID=71465 RepID=A0A3P6QWL0_CYLGO|nr:unnamed protein product [Cylicostephanus goldi]